MRRKFLSKYHPISLVENYNCATAQIGGLRQREINEPARSGDNDLRNFILQGLHNFAEVHKRCAVLYAAGTFAISYLPAPPNTAHTRMLNGRAKRFASVNIWLASSLVGDRISPEEKGMMDLSLSRNKSAVAWYQ